MNREEFFAMESNARKDWLNEQLDAGSSLDEVLGIIESDLEEMKAFGHPMAGGRFLCFYSMYRDYGKGNDA